MTTPENPESPSTYENDSGQVFEVGDTVLTPDGDVATVVYLAHDGQIAVETPWSAQWERFAPHDLELIAR